MSLSSRAYSSLFTKTPLLQLQGDISLRRLTSEQLQVALQGLPGKFSDHFGDNHALTVNKEGLRDARDAIVDGSGTGVVCNVGVGDPTIAVRILKIDAEEDDPRALRALPRCLQ